MPHTPIDLSELEALIGGDPFMLHELITVFLSESELLLGDISRALKEARLEDMNQSAQSLKSIAANMGLGELQTLANHIEVWHNVDTTGAHKIYHELLSVYQDIRPQLEARLKY